MYFRAFTALSFIAMPFWAEPLFASNTVFSIQESVSQALEKNPDVMKAREAIIQSQANSSLAVSKALPVINGQLQAAYNKASSASSSPLFGGEPYNQYLAAITLTQPLYDGGLLAGWRAVKEETHIKHYQVSIAERTLTQQVLESFYTVLLNERLLQILKETLKIDNETLGIAERYYKIGRAQKLDMLQLKTQAALLQPKIAQTESLMRTAAAQLATLFRDLDAKSIHLKGALVIPDAAWVNQMISRYRSDLPEILAARATIKQFENTRDVTMAAYWPKLNLVGDARRSAFTKRDLIDSNTTTWSVALQLNIPIFAGLGSFHQRSSLSSQETQLELDETRLADTVSVNQIQTEREFHVAETQLESTRQAAFYGRESLQEAQRSYRLQTINYLQYQSSQQAYLDSEVGYFNAKYNYIISLSKYFNALGVPTSLLVAKLDELSKKAEKE